MTFRKRYLYKLLSNLIIFDNLTKKKILKFDEDWVNESMKKKMFILRF